MSHRSRSRVKTQAHDQVCAMKPYNTVSCCRYFFPTIHSMVYIFRCMSVVSCCTYFFSLALIKQHSIGDIYPNQQARHLGIDFFYWEVFLCRTNHSVFYQSHVGRNFVVSNDLLTQAMVPCTSVCTVKDFL